METTTPEYSPEPEQSKSRHFFISVAVILTLCLGIGVGIYLAKTFLFSTPLIEEVLSIPVEENIDSGIVMMEKSIFKTKNVPSSKKILYLKENDSTSVGEMNYSNYELKSVGFGGEEDKTLLKTEGADYFKFIPEKNLVLILNDLTEELSQYDLKSGETKLLFNFKEIHDAKYPLSIDGLVLSSDKQSVAISLSIYDDTGIYGDSGHIYIVDLDTNEVQHIFTHPSGVHLLTWDTSPRYGTSDRIYFSEMIPKDCGSGDSFITIIPSEDGSGKYRELSKTSSVKLTDNETRRLIEQTTSPNGSYYYKVDSHPSTDIRGLDMCDDGRGSGIVSLLNTGGGLSDVIENDPINDFRVLDWTDDSRFIKYLRSTYRATWPEKGKSNYSAYDDYFTYDVTTGNRSQFDTQEDLEIWHSNTYPDYYYLYIENKEVENGQVVNLLVNGSNVATYSTRGRKYLQVENVVLGIYTP